MKPVVIDNPGDEKVVLQLDNDPVIELEPHQTKALEVKFGKRKITVNNGTPEEIYLDPEKDYLINPTRETYYIEHKIYFTSDEAKEEYLRYNKDELESEVEGMKVTGKFKKIENQLVITKQWKYGLDDPAKNSIKLLMSNRNRDNYTLIKIHRREDLENEIASETARFLMEEFEKQRNEQGQ
ncbi:MAG: hypothetical protein DWQ02_01635 [Bacteroidetes bacterium]|nr:MAG: hypothetical protein DWQ02_01635 [Bacteroidota bacterium]